MMFTHEVCLTPFGMGNLVNRLHGRDRVPTWIPAGLSTLKFHRQWLIHGTDRTSGNQLGRVLLVAARHSGEMNRQLEGLQSQVTTNDPTLLLVLGVNEASGHLAGASISAEGLEPLGWVTHVGPGFDRTPIGNRAADVGPAEIHSRTRGALGDDTVNRLQKLRIALIGCGRSGSLIAETLASLGVSALSFIDPDVIEEHNLGETAGITSADVGRPKSMFLAGVARRSPAAARTQLTAIVAPVQAPESLFAVKEADVLVACPDNPAARLATGVLAALYLKPLLDIGTGIVEFDGTRQIGADVRLVLADRCLLCLGGVAGTKIGREAMLRGEVPNPTVDFRAERLGSLRSLNSVAVGLGQTLLEQCVSNLLTTSTWLQLNVHSSGLPRITYPQTPPQSECPLCELIGCGDAALRVVRGLLQRV